MFQQAINQHWIFGESLKFTRQHVLELLSVTEWIRSSRLHTRTLHVIQHS